MLYVFHVDTGTMMTFDMNLAMESVSSLQTVISRACKIQEDKQVLLISGGESLNPKDRVGRYSAGTDTNPIFLFSKSTIESATPPSPSIHHGSAPRRNDIDLQSQTEGSLMMPPAYDTVASRAKLAVKFCEVDQEEISACEKLVHDQHLQQQGWAAVVANLEDITSALKQREDIFKEAYEDYLLSREHHLSVLSGVGESLQLLSKIPVLTCLISSTDQASLETVGYVFNLEDSSSHSSSPKTLFDWISSQDPQHSLHDMVEQCVKATEQFDGRVLDGLTSEAQQTFDAVHNSSMKEVKGLEDRLYGLDQIMCGARRLVHEQIELSQGFVQNKDRVSNLRDNSILPDLCASHKKQLIVMLNNHKNIREIKKKCRMAKEELAANLHTRLRWVMFVEKKICDIDGKLMIYHENLKRLRKRLDILQQIYNAPKVYAQLIVEVVRRRRFSLQYIQWASNIADTYSQLNSEEAKRREAFISELGCHFLQALFHGFEDFPPKFASEAPLYFDQNLPDISVQDVDMLKQSVPELANELDIPTDSAISDKLWTNTLLSCHEISPEEVKSIPTFVSLSATNSEIDVIRSESEFRFPKLDGTNISLEEQVAQCDPQADILMHSGPAISPKTFASFPRPKSLSEKLTLEMKHQKVNADGKDISFIKFSEPIQEEECPSSGEFPPVSLTDTGGNSRDEIRKSGNDSENQSSSEGPSTEERSQESTSSRKQRVKFTSETSPEFETSLEFTTADFYIDESMPSSMIDSPPKPCAVDKPEEKDILQGKLSDINKLEKELVELKCNLNKSSDKFKLIQTLLHQTVPELKHLIKSTLCIYKDHKADVINIFSSTRQQILHVVTTYNQFVNTNNNTQITNLKEKYEKEIQQLNITVDDTKKTLANLSEGEVALKQRISDMNNQLESVKQSCDDEIVRLKEQHKEVMFECEKKHTLETEVEVDKLRDEYKGTVNNLESAVLEQTNLNATLRSEINQINCEKEKALIDLSAKYENEKENVCSAMKQDHEQIMDKALKEQKLILEKESEDHMKKIWQQSEQKLTHDLEELKQSLLAEKEQAIVVLKQELLLEQQNTVEQERERLTLEKIKELKQQEEILEERKRLEVDALKSEFNSQKASLEEEFSRISRPMMFDSAIQTDESCEVITMADFESQLKDAEKRWSLESEHMMDKALKEQEEKHRTELKTQLEKAKDESLSLSSSSSSSKTSVIAEKQVLFNEAVNRVAMEKDKVIDDLRNREGELKTQVEKQQDTIKQLEKNQEELEDVKDQVVNQLRDKEREFSIMKRQLEDDLQISKQQLQQYQQHLQAASTVSLMTDSVAPASITPSSERLSELELNLKTKEAECDKLNQRVMELSMTASTKALAQDKVSITSCNIGDLVLFCLDERHDQYVVFTVGTTLHFLHSDCLDALGVKISPGEVRKSWVLAEIVDKEYCQAKKPQNRFKVPIGTKFYRVKARPWSRDPVAKKEVASSSKS